MIKYSFLFVLLPFVIYSCSSENGRFVSNVVKIRSMPRKVSPLHSRKAYHNNTYLTLSLRELKTNNCSKTFYYLHKYKVSNDNFSLRFWSAIANGKCGNYEKAITMLNNIYSNNLSNMWNSRVYAALGFFMECINENGENYIEIALAYDLKNKLALNLFFGPFKNLWKMKSQEEKKMIVDKLFDNILKWYKR